MSSSRLSVCVFLFFIHSVSLILAQLDLLYHECYENAAKYATNSTYQRNLNHLLNSITQKTSTNYGFYNSSYGQNDDKVYAIALCRPDMEADSCRNCIDFAATNLTSLCHNHVLAIAGYDDRGDNNCMLRYANYDIFGLMENGPYFFVDSRSNISEDIVGVFNRTRKRLLDRLINEAAARSSPNKYAAGEEAYSTIGSIYALAQCTPDLSENDCKQCLIDTTKLLPECCDRRQGGRVINPSCSFRFEINKFFKDSIARRGGSPVPAPLAPSSPSLLPPPNPTTPKGKKNHIVIILVILVVILVILMIIGITILLRWRKTEKDQNVEGIESEESLQFDFGTIRVATDNFSDANKLGQGGFGSVYKGMLSNGQQIAVKRLSKNSNQGELEFKNEVLVVARLQHRNLVRILGFCLEQKERILVYEFMPNASLDRFIFNSSSSEFLNWERRYKIVEGIARGLLYLHEDSRFRIIHRDLKASNVLLDSEMNPKISDFGMARLFEMDQTHSSTNRIVGTFGYMAPEYVMHGRFSVKYDVFSFGVLVLEIVSGQKRSSFGNSKETEDLLTYVSTKDLNSQLDSLFSKASSNDSSNGIDSLHLCRGDASTTHAKIAWRNWNKGTPLNLIDPKITVDSASDMMKCIQIGLLCVQECVSDRPSMASVVNMLNSGTITSPLPSKPGFFMMSSAISRTSSSLEHNSTSNEPEEYRNGTVPLSKNEVSISELSPR